MLTIEILHSPDCGRTRATARLVEEVVSRRCPPATVTLTDVSRDPAAAERFAGSPTVLVNGVDIQPEVPRAPGAG